MATCQLPVWTCSMPIVEHLQSAVGVIAGAPADVMEPVSRLMESAGIVRRAGVIIIYRTGGRKSDALVALVKEIIFELGAEKAVRLRIRPWWLLWCLPALKGARKPPITEINGKIFSQGIVPDKHALKARISKELSA